MQGQGTHSLDVGLSRLRAAGEQTRLRILWLLRKAELTVSDLVEILGQSQPRVSRHMKLLSEAELITRYQEGAWALFRLSERPDIAAFLDTITAPLQPTDPDLDRDSRSLQRILDARRHRADQYFAANAEEWNRIRSLHITEADVEAAMLDMGLQHDPHSLLDLGTGTGRMLQLFAEHVERGTGIDSSPDMLALARAGIAAGRHGHLQVRRGDLYALTIDDRFDLITIHMVLHYLEDPAAVLARASSLLTQGGRLLVAEFAPHSLEFLRDEHAHRRLGIARTQLDKWLGEARLAIVEHRSLAAPSDDAEKLTVTVTLAGLSES